MFTEIPRPDKPPRLSARDETHRLLELKALQEELEAKFLATPAFTWLEAGERVRYLVGLLASTTAGDGPHRKKLIADVLEDVRRLSFADVEGDLH